jgi:hypothetical protein
MMSAVTISETERQEHLSSTHDAPWENMNST